MCVRCKSQLCASGLAAVVALALASPLAAQTRLDPANRANRSVLETVDRIINSGRKDAPALDCRLDPVPPSLGFDLRLWAGYRLAIPASEFAGKPRTAATAVVRVDPVEPAGRPVYLGRRIVVPAIPANIKKGLYMGAGGGFSVGAGRYKASMVLADAQGRICLKQWTVKAKAPRGGITLLAPGEVASSSGEWNGFPPAGGRTAARRAIIFIDAHPVYRRRNAATLSWRDQMTLLNVLNSVLSQGGFDSARVVAFDLSNRKVIFDDPDFQPASIDPLADALAAINLATVDYSTLSEGPSERQFLESLVATRTPSPERGELVFIAPNRRLWGRTGPRDDSVWEGFPRPWLISLLPAPVPEGAVVDFAKSGRARAFSVYSPSDLASALRRITTERPGSRP